MVRRTSLRIVPVALAGIAIILLTGCGNAEQVNIPSPNTSRVALLVERIDPQGESFILHGRVLSSESVGSAVSMAEVGQDIALAPYYPREEPDLSDPAQRKVVALGSRPPGDTVRCSIALDSRGGWRILSAD